MVLKIAVIGGGIIGLNSAIRISEHFRDSVKVIIFTSESTPNTTGDIAAGTWTTYFLLGSDNSREKILKWGLEGFQEWHRLWKNGQALEAGICLVPGYHLTNKHKPIDDFCQDIVFGREVLSSDELKQFNIDHSDNYTSGSRFVSFVCDASRLQRYLMERFIASGGDIQIKNVKGFKEFADEFDFIVNCTGLSSRELANDPQIIPIRGQTMRVEAPWQLFSVTNEASQRQIVPNIDSVFLGGTSQYGDFNTKPDPVDSKHIKNGSIMLSKSMFNAKFISERVGLRPTRSAIRLEDETIISDKNRIVKVIHNYGHGGSGVTLAWACAGEVVLIIKKNLDENHELNIKIKNKL